jgi:hypothetical protein
MIPEDVILALLGKQLSLNYVGILPETMMYIAVLSRLSVLLPYTYCSGIIVGPTFLLEYTTLHMSSFSVGECNAIRFATILV